MIDQMEIRKLREELQEKRQFGVVHFDIQALENFNKGNDRATIDAYVISLGFQALGENWVAINRGYATEQIDDLLRNIQFFHDNGLMSQTDADDLTSKILGLFSEQTRYYTNENRPRNTGWSVTNATFNTGVVFIDNKQLGIFWVDDED